MSHLTNAQLITLKAEIIKPAYNGMQDGDLAAALNTPNAAISVNRGTIDTQTLVECILRADMPAAAADRDWLLMVCSGTRVRVDTGSVARAGLLALFNNAATTKANLTAAATKTPASRAEEMFGIDQIVDDIDVAKARLI
jgi:hypothetical protein